VLLHDKESRGALAYLALAGEVVRRMESRARPPATEPVAEARDAPEQAS